MRALFKHRLFFIPISLFMLMGCDTDPDLDSIENKNATLESTALTSSAAGSWQLVWEDNFNTLNATDWVTVDAPGGINDELQYHRPQNRFISGGNLNIVAKNENFGGRNYTSGKIASTKRFRYGKFEFRAKLPPGKGMHSALWLVQGDCSANVPCPTWPPEIDIVEGLGDQVTTAYQTVHYQTCEGCRWPNWDYNFSGPTISNFSQNWHVYSVEWFEDVIRWYVDGTMTKEWYPSAGAFMPAEDMRIIIDIAVGGSFPGSPDGTTVFPQTMFVDYVKVYEKKVAPPTSSGNLVVRAKGRTGQESIKLNLDGQTVSTWNLSQNFTDYTYNGQVSGKKAEVVFFNDGDQRDVYVDYIRSGGVTIQAESRPVNTGVWQNNSCGGSFSQDMNCNGLIDFGTIGGGTSTGGTVQINARGVAGGEAMALEVGGQVVSNYVLTTSNSTYSYSGNVTGKNIKVRFTNDGGTRDIILDNIVVNGQVVQAESRASNTSVWQNNSCGGSYSEIMNCNGAIDFGNF